MNCPLCGDKGIVRLGYRDGSPDEFGVCLCAIGLSMRSDSTAVGKRTGSPLWHVWATREQVSLERVAMVEDLLEEDVLTRVPRVDSRSQASAIAAAMRTRRPRL